MSCKEFFWVRYHNDIIETPRFEPLKVTALPQPPAPNANPNYYQSKSSSPIDLMHAYGIAIPFARGSVMKYIARGPEKNGVEDTLKALWYTIYLAAREGGHPHDIALRIAKEHSKTLTEVCTNPEPA